MINIKYSTQKKIYHVLYYLGTIALVCLFVAPLYWMVISSFKPETQIFKSMDSLKAFFISTMTIKNYIGALQRVPLLRYIWNTFFATTMATLLGLAVNSLCGYGLARLHIPGTRLIISIIVALIIIPFQSIMIPLYIITFKLGMVNKYSALIIPFGANCFYIYMFYSFFLGIPKELEEAAYIDGASVLRTFFSVIIPLSRPVFATISILSFTLYWSDFLWPLLVTIDESTRTVQVGLQMFFTDPPWDYGQIMAALTIGTAPMAIVFLSFQKYYVQGISTSGIKG